MGPICSLSGIDRKGAAGPCGYRRPQRGCRSAWLPATARVNTAQIRKRGDGLPGSAQGPHPASQAPPTPTRGTAPPYDDTGRQGKGGYLSGIDRKGREGASPSSTLRLVDMLRARSIHEVHSIGACSNIVVILARKEPKRVFFSTEGRLQMLKLTGVGPAEEFEIDLAPRLNVITGGNGLGKTFLLECIWWALTGNWIEYPARPRESAKAASIAFQFGKPNRNEKDQITKYSWDELAWDLPSKSNTLPGLSIFAQVDGSFAVWDPVKALLVRKENYTGRATDALTRLSRSSILHGLGPDQYGKIQKTTGLINDWIRWQEAADQRHFEALKAALYKLSPHPDQEALIPGPPTRMPELGDSRDIPTLKFSYGNVPIRSLEAEKAIEDANQLQLEKDPPKARVQEVSDKLVKVLAPDDKFWPVWTYFAKQRGVSLDTRTKAT